eukprot:CAMPEP_0194266106 /NCGR_PEP_ID=MMETSP0169-20130528/1125_1 /TAXON_ID=218684 /ORGANISM="Corethron pennatum, Strain L29A3" /LENGTH=605 /DNA_ID=CAMNT_0039006717 /DNA_START=204 /DNA_END=2021 /DNA_ORIENTATION=+
MAIGKDWFALYKNKQQKLDIFENGLSKKIKPTKTKAIFKKRMSYASSYEASAHAMSLMSGVPIVRQKGKISLISRDPIIRKTGTILLNRNKNRNPERRQPREILRNEVSIDDQNLNNPDERSKNSQKIEIVGSSEGENSPEESAESSYKEFERVPISSNAILSMKDEYDTYHATTKSTAALVLPTLSKIIRVLLQSPRVKSCIKKHNKNDVTLLESVFTGMEVTKQKSRDVTSLIANTNRGSRENGIKTALESLAASSRGKNTTIGSWKDLARLLETVFDHPPIPPPKATKFNNSGLRVYRQLLQTVTKSDARSSQDYTQIEAAQDLVNSTKKKLPPKLLLLEERVKIKRAEDEARIAEKERLARERALRPLTQDEQEQVHDIIYGRGNGREIIATSETDSVQRDSLRRLRPGTWLNDEVIHYFLLMLARRDQELSKSLNRKRSHFFKSFFVTKLLDERGYCYSNVKRWSKKVPGKDIFQLDKIICPVNVANSHWTCAVIFVEEKRIQYYDSMGCGGRRTLEGLLQYMVDEYKDKKKKVLDVNEWTLVPSQPDTPEQANGYDCGVFTCMFADFISRNQPLTFTQDHVTECRERIALSILNGSALQ